MTRTAFDTELLDAISSLLNDPGEASNPNRRRSQRHQYSSAQLLAPFDGERLPCPGELKEVMCHDLSPSGFSYFSNSPPATKQVIVGLGQIPFRFFVAEVVHVRPGDDRSGRAYHIGCRFLRRLEAI